MGGVEFVVERWGLILNSKNRKIPETINIPWVKIKTYNENMYLYSNRLCK